MAMTKRSRRSSATPLMYGQLMMASMETIGRRMLLMASGTCSPAEYQRMMQEKTAAMQESAIALATGRGDAAAMRPFLKRARANAKRLRR